MGQQKKKRIAVVPGDGIGPEVIGEGLRLLTVINGLRGAPLEFVPKDWGAEKWLREGVGLPEGTLEDLRHNYAAIYFGAVGDARIPDMAHGREILLKMRTGLDLFVNLRPLRLFHESLSPLKKNGRALDILVFRENTEDLYVGAGSSTRKGSPEEVCIDESIHTRRGVERIVRYAFESMRRRGRKRLALVDKANAIRYGGELWQSVFFLVAKEYPDIQTEHFYVDTMAYELVRDPSRFDGIVTSNLFGDILTDLGAALAGGLGIAASANLNPAHVSLFEPIHGSAPSLVGTEKANPMAAFLSAGLMLDHLGIFGVSEAVEAAVSRAIAEGELTPDLGGTSTTRKVADFLIADITERLRNGPNTK